MKSLDVQTTSVCAGSSTPDLMIFQGLSTKVGTAGTFFTQMPLVKIDPVDVAMTLHSPASNNLDDQ